MNRMLAICYDWLLCQFGFNGDWSRFTFDEKRVSLLAIALQRTSPCSAHAGIVYRNAVGRLRFLHFANHESLRDEECAAGQYAFAIPPLKEEELEYLAGFCIAYIARTRAESFRTVLSLT